MLLPGAVRLVAPAIALAAVVACVPADDPRPPAGPDASAAFYEAPDGAPGFCTRLASVGELRGLPASIGTLLTGADVEARTQISQTVRELREVLSDVQDEGGHEELETALDDLVRALGSAVDGPLGAPESDAVSAGLAGVGAQAQEPCGFPT